MLTQQIISGLAVGCIYALIALGYSMVYSILRFINFAHGGIFTFGAYFGWMLVGYLANKMQFGLSVVVAITVAAVLTAVLGVGIEKIAYRPIRFAGFLPPFMTSLGMSLVLIYGAMAIWSPTTQNMPQIYAGRSVVLGQGVTITWLQLIIFAVTLGLTFLLHLFVVKTKMGMAIRAAAEDQNAACLMGINIDKVISITFAIGSAIAAIGGILVGSYYSAVYPLMGWMAGLKGFVAAILGGLGSLTGAAVAGVILGLAENLGAAYLIAGYKDAIAFVILVIVLLWRPDGIFGKSGAGRV